MDNIRNFAIIAHIDHGKSTLADRLLELTGMVKVGEHNEQMLDRNPISRERGITIKLAPVRMIYKNSKYEARNPKQFKNLNFENSNLFRNSDLEIRNLSNSELDYILNLIDTPGHVDFSYEVDRTLACVEGVILLVDATQGIQAQTIANAYKAIDKNLVIIPVINKIDMANAQIEQTRQQLIDFLGVTKEEILLVSAKTGEGVEEVLRNVIGRIPAPNKTTIFNDPFDKAQGKQLSTKTLKNITDKNEPLKALIFDSYYDPHRGVIAFLRVFSGSVKRGMKVRLCQSQKTVDILEAGIFTPDLLAKDSLNDGEIGYIATNLKNIHQIDVGDTVVNEKSNDPPLPGYKKTKPMVFASVFTTDTADYLNLKKALEKLYLNDSSLQFNSIYSKALGAGFRVGFLGLLHADVVRERLEREHNLSLVLTPPQVEYEKNGLTFLEPIVKIFLITPNQYTGAVMQLCENYRAQFITMDNKNQITLTYEMPLSEMITDFYDSLKSVSSGYASLDWEILKFVPVKADKLMLLLNNEPIEEFSEIVVQERAYEKASQLVKKMREIIPRQQYEIKIQAQYKGKIIASERISPFRKDVLIK
ncbi:hypothetical protein AUK04_04670, partial [Candidatus Roizmanbacteria bacterium CG2_30_33_16]